MQQCHCASLQHILRCRRFFQILHVDQRRITCAHSKARYSVALRLKCADFAANEAVGGLGVAVEDIGDVQRLRPSCLT